jgi:hypothetical protein
MAESLIDPCWGAVLLIGLAVLYAFMRGMFNSPRATGRYSATASARTVEGVGFRGTVDPANSIDDPPNRRVLLKLVELDRQIPVGYDMIPNARDKGALLCGDNSEIIDLPIDADGRLRQEHHKTREVMEREHLRMEIENRRGREFNLRRRADAANATADERFEEETEKTSKLVGMLKDLKGSEDYKKRKNDD